MDNEETLDEEFASGKEAQIFIAVRWWERRRLLYNVLLFGVEFFVSISHYKNLLAFGVVSGIIQTIIVNIIANAFYSMGWGVEVLATYYFEHIKFTETSRRILYVLGLLFSLGLAWLAYNAALNY